MTSWLFNLLDFGEEEEVFVIDSNDRVIDRLKEYKEEIIQKKERELQKRVDDFFESLEYDEEGKPIFPVDEEGYYIVPEDFEGNPLVIIDEEGNIVTEPEEEEPEVSEEDTEQSEEIKAQIASVLESAQRQADDIISQAEARVNAMMDHAKEEGRKEGYNEGVAQAVSEYHDKEKALEEEKQMFLSELNAHRENMEAELVDIICDVVDKAFKVRFSDAKEMILHLVDNTIMNIGNSKTFIIRVSEKDAIFLKDNKEVLTQRVGSDAILDIITDPLMEEGSCMIETDGGVFNCGLDTQMDSLIRDIKTLNI